MASSKGDSFGSYERKCPSFCPLAPVTLRNTWTLQAENEELKEAFEDKPHTEKNDCCMSHHEISFHPVVWRITAWRNERGSSCTGLPH
ncbi:hypothetical protein CDAR_193071 [Caerostris darwini]|uniref:Uncharacterized protein n=1 Tax=Caerostris darwini TaxID=1538125 RepID=A0AAV4U0E1_9ARAC|nr:hypothetical protein CDAR_193071 [Caerostris darwini]